MADDKKNVEMPAETAGQSGNTDLLREEKIRKKIGEDKYKILQEFNEGRKYYKLMMFEEAKQCFFNALKIDKDDGPSQVYFARCKHYLESPPPEDWDGVFVMRTK